MNASKNAFNPNFFLSYSKDSQNQILLSKNNCGNDTSIRTKNSAKSIIFSERDFILYELCLLSKPLNHCFIIEKDSTTALIVNYSFSEMNILIKIISQGEILYDSVIIPDPKIPNVLTLDNQEICDKNNVSQNFYPEHELCDNKKILKNDLSETVKQSVPLHLEIKAPEDLANVLSLTQKNIDLEISDNQEINYSEVESIDQKNLLKNKAEKSIPSPMKEHIDSNFRVSIEMTENEYFLLDYLPENNKTLFEESKIFCSKYAILQKTIEEKKEKVRRDFEEQKKNEEQEKIIKEEYEKQQQKKKEEKCNL